MDINRRSMNGLEATRAITARHPKQLRSALSMHDDAPMVHRQDAGGTYLSKSAGAQAITDAIRRPLKKQSLL
jgi:DNA-binding NarL/FixJ family response regulator